MSLKYKKRIILIFSVLLMLMIIPTSFASDVSDDGTVIGSADDAPIATSVYDVNDSVSASVDAGDVLTENADVITTPEPNTVINYDLNTSLNISVNYDFSSSFSGYSNQFNYNPLFEVEINGHVFNLVDSNGKYVNYIYFLMYNHYNLVYNLINIDPTYFVRGKNLITFTVDRHQQTLITFTYLFNPLNVTIDESQIYVDGSVSTTGTGTKYSPYKTIGEAIDAANALNESTIYIAPGTYTESGFSLTKNVTIVGAGIDDVIIDAGQNDRIFDITTDGVIANIKNLTLANAKSTTNLNNQGAAIRIYLGTIQDSKCELYLDSVRFVNNTAYGEGGAIYNDGGYHSSRNNILVINNCEFINCSSLNSNGGAIQTQSTTTITNSLFRGCRAGGFVFHGGAIKVASTNAANIITISNCTFENNTAERGVIFSSVLEIGEFNITNNAFAEEGIVIFGLSFGQNITSIENNWWGTNNPDFTAMLSDVAAPKVFAQFNMTANPTEIKGPYASSVISTKFVWNGTNVDATGLLPARTVTLTTNVSAVILGSYIGNYGYEPTGIVGSNFNFGASNPGIYTVNATVDNEKNSVSIMKIEVIPEITIEPNSTTIFVGENYDLSKNVTAIGVSSVTYISNNTSIAEVTSEGVITAKSPGTVNITVISMYVKESLAYFITKNFLLTVVLKENATISIYGLDVYEGENATLTVELPVDASGNVTVGMVTATLTNGTAFVVISGLPLGNTTLPVIYSGDEKYNPLETSIKITVKELPEFIINAPDVVKYYHGPERFVVTITDGKGNPLADESVYIIINGVKYNKTTDENGTASLGLNLNSGYHPVRVVFNNTTVNATVIILSTVQGNDLVKVFRNATPYTATFRDSEGNYLAPGTEIQYNINGVMYKKEVGENGVATLNINLAQGNYIITAMNLVTGENCANNVTVLPRIVENNDITKFYKNDTQYTVTLIGDDGNPVGAGEVVTFNINGVFYNRTTNASGEAKLNINLPPGDYIITAEYKQCKVSNNITVKPVLFADDLNKTKGGPEQFIATLLDGQGNPYEGQIITFNINGVFYNKITDSNGHAKLNINLPAGEYIITSSYNGTNVASKVTVKA